MILTSYCPLYCVYPSVLLHVSMYSIGESPQLQLMRDLLVRTFSWLIRAIQIKSPIPLKCLRNHVDFFPASHFMTKLRDSITRREPWLLPAKSMQASLSVALPMGASTNKLVHCWGSTFQCHPKLASALRNLAKVNRISWMSDWHAGRRRWKHRKWFLWLFHVPS